MQLLLVVLWTRGRLVSDQCPGAGCSVGSVVAVGFVVVGGVVVVVVVVVGLLVVGFVAAAAAAVVVVVPCSPTPVAAGTTPASPPSARPRAPFSVHPVAAAARCPAVMRMVQGAQQSPDRFCFRAECSLVAVVVVVVVVSAATAVTAAAAAAAVVVVVAATAAGQVSSHTAACLPPKGASRSPLA